MPSEHSGGTESRSTARQVQAAAKAMVIIGCVAVATGLNLLLFSSWPLLPLNPAWQLQWIANVLANAPYFLFGLLLINVARAFDQENRRIRDFVRLSRKVSLAILILLIAFIPVQFIAANNLIKQRNQESYILFKTWEKAIQAVQSTSDEDEFRRIVASLQNSDTMPAVFDAPFPIIKARALKSLNSRLSALKNQAENSVPQMWQQFLGNALRNCLQIAFFVTGFGALSNDKIKNKIYDIFGLRSTASTSSMKS